MADAATVHQQMFDAVQARDFDKMRELYQPGFTYMTSDGTRGGIDESVGEAELYMGAFPDMVLEVRHQSSAGENGPSVIEFTARGTHTAPLGDIPATGKQVELLVCNIVETRDGKLVSEREYYDTLALLKQLGLAEG